MMAIHLNHRWMRRIGLLLFFTSLTPAWGCPHCSEGIRKQIQAGIFNDQFIANVGITALPFAVLAGIVIAIHKWPFGIGPRR